MIVTVNTDASFSREHERGAYAFWIKSDEFKIQKSGMLKEKIARAEIAEFQCLINALWALADEDVLQKTKRIIVNTDCLNVIHLLQYNEAAIKRWGLLKWGEGYRDKLEMTAMGRFKNATIEYRHVKAHETTGTAKTWVNDWCDRKAKEALRTELKLKPLKK